MNTEPHDAGCQSDLERFHDRLQRAVGDMSYRKLGRLTDTHPETVRRYIQGQSPSALFLINLCRVFGISGDWLLTGRGTMRSADSHMHALHQAKPADLLGALAKSLADQSERLSRIEQLALGGTPGDVPALRERKPDARPKAIKLGARANAAAQPKARQAPAGTVGDELDAEALASESVTRIRQALSRHSAA